MMALVPSLRRHLPGKAVAAFSPADLSGLVGWWDASDTGTITQSGGLVSQWDDLSGNGNHLTQGTGSQQPTTGTRTINSLNTLDFQGNDELTCSVTVGSDNQSFAAVVYLDNANVGRLLSANAGGNDFDRATAWELDRNNATSWNIYNNWANRYSNSGSMAAAASVIARYVSGGECTIWVNGATGSHSANGTAGLAVTQINVGGYGGGGGGYLDGILAEAIYGEEAWDDTEFGLIDTYFSTKWGI